jgi:hypothetical protein
MLDKPSEQRSSKINDLYWQTCARGRFDPQRLFHVLTNRGASKDALANPIVANCDDAAFATQLCR